ncbi:MULTISPECIES: hypothetical protein [unclassified Labrenzia]|jgi:DNA-binding transcriptional LysR family regulator|uniref:hypothetical protein n=1 Tax=unclassified Labrenzia TaxID=2648686 RepID=UPI00256FBF40|nr:MULTISPECIES: hypothetical protein [unclassified Labrenzia]
MISHASNCLPLKSSFGWRFSFSTMALRVMTQNSNFWSALSKAKSQGVVNAKNFTTGPPYWLVHDRVTAGTLVRLLASFPAFFYDTYAVWQQNPRMPLKIRLTVDALAAALPSFMLPPGR